MKHRDAIISFALTVAGGVTVWWLTRKPTSQTAAPTALAPRAPTRRNASVQAQAPSEPVTEIAGFEVTPAYIRSGRY